MKALPNETTRLHLKLQGVEADEGKWSYWNRQNDSHRSKTGCSYEQLGNNEKRMHTANEVGAVKERMRSSAEGPVEEEPYQVEEAHYQPQLANTLYTSTKEP